MTARPVMKGQTHFTELNIDGDRVIAVCGDMEVRIIPGATPTVWVPGSPDEVVFYPDQIPNLIAALHRANDYLQGRG